MSKRPLCQAAVLLVILLVLLQQFLPEVFRQEKIPAEDGETVIISGRIYDRREANDKTCYYLEEIIFLKSSELSYRKDVTEKNTKEFEMTSDNSDADASSKFQGKCIVYCKDEQNYSIGNYIQVTGTLAYFQEATNPGQFDAGSYYRGLGFGFSVFQAEIQYSDNQKDNVKEALYSFRANLHDKLDVLAGEQASILQAMLLGEKSQMDSEIKELYQKSGISHILVISGLHFSLLGLSLYKLLRRMGGSFGVAGFLSMLVLFFYGIMTGFGVSAIRAFIMFVVSVGADICGRSYDFPTSLAVAVIFLVLDNHYVLYQSGFLLSVGAILGMIVFIPVVEELYPNRNLDEEQEEKRLGLQAKKDVTGLITYVPLWGRRLLSSIRCTLVSGMRSGIAIQLMTFPILLYSFFEFSTYSILLNCLILPLVPVVVLGAIAAVVISFLFPWLAQLVILPSIWVLELYEFLCRVVEKLPASVIVTGQPPMWRIVVYYTVLLGIAVGMWHLKKLDAERDVHIFRNVITVIVGITVLFLAFSMEDDGMEISMLDVGQGQSIYIRCGSEDVLYDGGSTDVSDVGKYRIAPFLKARGVDCLELVIVSHLDADHYNGISQILEEELIEVECLMLPVVSEPDEAYTELVELAKVQGITVLQVEKDDVFEVEDTRFHVLHPYSGYEAANRNDASIVMAMKYGEFSMLFTGDVEAKGEKAVIRTGLWQENGVQNVDVLRDGDMLPDIDVLQVAHHGSATSSSKLFLNLVSPKMAWISCGEGNRYGHPAVETLERLEDEGCRVFRTDTQGCVTLRLENEIITE